MPRIPYPRRLKLAVTPTPLEAVPRLAELAGGRHQILFKRDDLTGSALSGNKVRKLEFALAEALRLGADTVITVGAVQSNHCRATALCCARLGIGCHLVLRGPHAGAADGNLLLDQLAGATITHLGAEGYSTRQPEIIPRLIADYAARGKKPYYIPVGASNAIGAWGYVRAYAEIMAQAERRGITLDHVVVATGSGGTQAGLIAGRALAGGRKPEIWGVNVCDDGPYFEAEIRRILEEMNANHGLNLKPAATPIRMLDGHVGAGYGIPGEACLETIKAAGRLEGQILDPVYSGKGCHGMLEEIRAGRFGKRGTIVFIHTGGMFGLFPQRDAFAFPAPAAGSS